MLRLFSFRLFDIVLISGTRNVLCRRVQAISKKKDLPELLKGLITAPRGCAQPQWETDCIIVLGSSEAKLCLQMMLKSIFVRPLLETWMYFEFPNTEKWLLRALTRAASPCNETHADRRLLWHLSNNLLHSEKPSLLQASRVCLKIWFNAPLKHSQTEFISSFFGQSHNNTTIFRVMEARKHLSPFYWNIYSVIDFCYSLFICPNMK